MESNEPQHDTPNEHFDQSVLGSLDGHQQPVQSDNMLRQSLIYIPGIFVVVGVIFGGFYVSNQIELSRSKAELDGRYEQYAVDTKVLQDRVAGLTGESAKLITQAQQKVSTTTVVANTDETTTTATEVREAPASAPQSVVKIGDLLSVAEQQQLKESARLAQQKLDTLARGEGSQSGDIETQKLVAAMIEETADDLGRLSDEYERYLDSGEYDINLIPSLNTLIEQITLVYYASSELYGAGDYQGTIDLLKGVSNLSEIIRSFIDALRPPVLNARGGGTRKSKNGPDPESTTQPDSSPVIEVDAGSDSIIKPEPPEALGQPLGTINLLPPGQHIGLQKGFSANTSAGQKAVDEHFAEAIDNGMQVYLKHIDWQTLEPAQGQYDMTELRAELDELKAQGLRPAIQLAVVDSTSLNIPDYLRGDTELTLAGGMRLDDPKVIAAHNALMDRLVPILSEYDGWAIILLNEADNHVKDDSTLIAEYSSFLAQARDYIHSLNPDLAVAATLTAYLEEDYETVRPMIDESDFASYNFYCAGGTTDGDEYGGSVAYTALKARFVNHQLPAAQGKEIMIQEMGCATGYSDNQSDTAWFGPTGQAEYFAAMQRIISEHPSIRAAFQFQLIDSNRADDQRYYGDPLLAEGVPVETVNYLLEGLGTLGMLEYDTGAAKSSWNAFVEMVRGEIVTAVVDNTVSEAIDVVKQESSAVVIDDQQVTSDDVSLGQPVVVTELYATSEITLTAEGSGFIGPVCGYSIHSVGWSEEILPGALADCTDTELEIVLPTGYTTSDSYEITISRAGGDESVSTTYEPISEAAGEVQGVSDSSFSAQLYQVWRLLTNF